MGRNLFHKKTPEFDPTRAARIVNFLIDNNKNEEARELFSHFVDHFNLLSAEEIMNFAIESGFFVAKKVRDYSNNYQRYKYM